MASNSLSEREKHVRKKIELELEHKREKRRLELLSRRIEMAREGLAAFDKRNFPEASKSFVMYIRILEDWKKVQAGTLNPSHFDIRKDLAELLLISSIYWHLVKLLDNAPSPAGEAQFRHFMSQFVLFSKGMTFTPLAAETLRKYIRSAPIRHMADFKNAYKLLANTKCFIVTELLEYVDDQTLERFRTLRDERLRTTVMGRRLIWSYYQWSPAVARRLSRSPFWMKRVVGRLLDWLARL